MSDFLDGELVLFAVVGDGPGERVGGEPFDRVGQLRNLVLAPGRKTFDALDLQFAGRERAGLVHGNDRNLAEIFDGGATAEKDATAGAPGDGGEDCGGVGEDEGAG